MNSDFCSRVDGLIKKTGSELILLRALWLLLRMWDSFNAGSGLI